jgi:hypothetical protein
MADSKSSSDIPQQAIQKLDKHFTRLLQAVDKTAKNYASQSYRAFRMRQAIIEQFDLLDRLYAAIVSPTQAPLDPAAKNDGKNEELAMLFNTYTDAIMLLVDQFRVASSAFSLSAWGGNNILGDFSKAGALYKQYIESVVAVCSFWEKLMKTHAQHHWKKPWLVEFVNRPSRKLVLRILNKRVLLINQHVRNTTGEDQSLSPISELVIMSLPDPL